MVLAYHVVFGSYGFWLPSDPRGSWSEFVASWELYLYGGGATTTTARHSLAGQAHDRKLRQQVKQHLRYPEVVFNDRHVASIANGFGEMVAKSDYEVFACSIMPQHVHLVLGRYRYNVETMVRLLKAQASHRMIEDDLHPMAQWPNKDGSRPTPWAEKCWKVFLNADQDIIRAIRYVENNPFKDGKPAQLWPFVKAYAPGSALAAMASGPSASSRRG